MDSRPKKEKWRKSCPKPNLRQVTLKESAIRPAGTTYEDIDDTSKKIILLHEDAPHFFGIDGQRECWKKCFQTHRPIAVVVFLICGQLYLDLNLFLEIKHSNESTEERPLFEMSLPVNPHTASSTCSKDSTMKNDVITTVTSTEVNASVGHYSVISKAKEMEADIMKFLKKLQTYKISTKKIGNSILNEYDDVTKSMSDDERDELTEYLCTF
ncbi:unnamed protein product [Mytilus coruscus]|uniref:Uncharacterized protein n=1 Tax=Mytilus coruscus TaxID=42192 RepID=A0A6J8EL77_MYTCO|nr:unnamed protein product [Mytilus coruscus]